MHDAEPTNGRAIAIRGSMVLSPVLGEYAWHSLTVDPTIADMSDAHVRALDAALALGSPSGRRLEILEVGAYAHYSGYRLAEQRHAHVTLLDISASTLRLGRREAERAGCNAANPNVVRVAADFHELPFPDGVFDVVFVASSVHHTLQWRQVVDQLIRVAAPDGLIVLENEPCLREFCLYSFRCNREALFTPVERALHEQGVLRTVAEPYVGSRPETLFGMVENQRIPLPDLMASVGDACEILHAHYAVEMCMTQLEHDLVDAAPRGVAALVRDFAPRLVSAVGRAREVETDATRGIPFRLPTDEELRDLLEQVAPRLSVLPRGDDPWRRYELARLFGAGVKIIGRKRNGSRRPWQVVNEPVEVDGVLVAYPEPLRTLLLHGARGPVDLQTAAPADVHAVFPDSDWSYERTDTGIGNVCLRGRTGKIHVPALRDSRSTLLLLRINLSVVDRPFVAELWHGGRCASRLEIFQTEAWLMRAVLAPGQDAVELRLNEMNGAPLTAAGCAISVAAAIDLSLAGDAIDLDQVQS